MSRRCIRAARPRPGPELADKGARLGDKRTIRADVEVMILGPDRMTIRLFRKRHGAEADARAQ